MLLLAISLFVIYGLLLFVGCALSDKLIFPVRRQTYRDGADIIKLKTSDGARISAVYLLNPEARYTILFSHGNGEDLGDDQPFLEMLRDHGFSVFAYDYHGYGTSEGAPTEKSVYLDVQAAYDYLVHEKKIAPERIIIHGRSVGGGPSINLASQKPVAGLILESPFTTAFCVLTQARLLPFDKFCNIDKIARVKCPVLVIHAKDDRVVPFRHGLKIYAKAPEPKMHFWAESGGHNDLLAAVGNRYWRTLKEFEELVLRSAREPVPNNL